VSRLDLCLLEESMNIVNSWETEHFAGVLTAAEAASLIRAIGSKLQDVVDGRIAARGEVDFACFAHAIVQAWEELRQPWHLNDAEAAALAESIAEALETTPATMIEGR
jgi:hypothetical protein